MGCTSPDPWDMGVPGAFPLLEPHERTIARMRKNPRDVGIVLKTLTT